MFKILDLNPPAAVPGGEIFIRWTGAEIRTYTRPVVHFGRSLGHLVSSSADLIVVTVPEEISGSEVQVTLDGRQSNKVSCEIAGLMASNLHIVANPVLDIEGNLFTTFSGKRGEKVQNSILKVSSSCTVQPFVSDLMNPTGIAFNSVGEMFVSSRNDGSIFKISPFGEKSIYAKGMGVATGIAFDANDNLYVGDRTGTLFKIDRKREIFVFATLEPSVAAYHLAFDAEQNLYVTGPTTSSYDQVHKITSDGNVSTYFTGLGRPQGLAFDTQGNLYVAASLGGRRGIVRITPNREASLAVAGINLVGLAFGYHRDLYVASNSSLFHLSFAAIGKPLP
ncbi:MAG TPA: gluconolaconase [Terriglobia bacterium]|nr:gluconolaconase [Terriglobia bacterium]